MATCVGPCYSSRPMVMRKATAKETSSGTPWLAQRRAVLDAAQAMHAEGLVVETSGNVSARVTDGTRDLIAITASSTRYDTMTDDDVVVVDHEGESVIGDALPSTELLTHAAIYRARPGVGAVMHTHSTYASALAVAGIAIPSLIDEMIIVLGDSVRVADYAFPSTAELGESAVAALGERNSVLLKNHGFVGVGRSVGDALKACRLGEQLAKIFVLARLMGNADKLPASAIEVEVELFRMRQSVNGDGAGAGAVE